MAGGAVDKDDCCVMCGRYLPEGHGHVCADCVRKASEALNSCDGCVWWGVRPQKCSCCRRNVNMKDNYRTGGGG